MKRPQRSRISNFGRFHIGSNISKIQNSNGLQCQFGLYCYSYQSEDCQWSMTGALKYKFVNLGCRVRKCKSWSAGWKCSSKVKKWTSEKSRLTKAYCTNFAYAKTNSCCFSDLRYIDTSYYKEQFGSRCENIKREKAESVDTYQNINRKIKQCMDTREEEENVKLLRWEWLSADHALYS